MSDGSLPISNFLHAWAVYYSKPVHFGKVTIIGVGLLGGSIGLTLRKRKLARQVCGYVRRKAALSDVRRSKAVNVATTSLNEAVRDADLIILCTPVSQMKTIAQAILPNVKKGAILTDVGSVKSTVTKALDNLTAKAGVYFVGSHPMAGSEKCGVRSARHNLFDGSVCVVTPTPRSNKSAVSKVKQFWKSLGSNLMVLDPALHDKLVSRASHLPHLVAATLAHQVLDVHQDKPQARLCATGFRDTTRVAGGSPAMWTDIVMANRQNLRRDLELYQQKLRALQRILERQRSEALSDFLVVAQSLRLQWDKHRVSSSQE